MVKEKSPVLPTSQDANPHYGDLSHAVRAVSQGRASESQQIQAMRFIVERVGWAYDATFYPSSPRLSEFAQGRRWVGMELLRIINETPKRRNSADAPTQ